MVRKTLDLFARLTPGWGTKGGAQTLPLPPSRISAYQVRQRCLQWSLALGLSVWLCACQATPTPTPYPTPIGGFPTADPIFTANPATRVPANAECAIAYAFHDSLFCLGADGSSLGRDGLPLPIATATANTTTITHPRISPDGKWVAYLLTSATQKNALWVAALDGSDQHPVVNDRSIFAYDWQPGTHRLWFSTQAATGANNADLWWVDIDTEALTSILPVDSALGFLFSPTGQTLALLQTAGIRWFNPTDASTQPALDFAAPLSTPPILTWMATGEALFVALPVASGQLQLYQLSLTSAAQDLGHLAVDASLAEKFAPMFSPNGEWVVYATLPTPEQAQPELRLRALRTGTEAPLVGPGNIQGWGWAPDGQAFAYTQFTPTGVSGVFLAHPDLATEPIAPGFMAVRDLHWLDANSMVFYGQLTTDTWGLYLQQVGREAKLLVNVLIEEVNVDVR